MRDWEGSLKAFVDELRRRRVFRVAVVFLVVGWVLIQVAGATFGPLGLPDWTVKLVIVLVGLSFVLACALAWTYDLTTRGIERTAPTAVPEAAAPEASVAILPFSDLSEGHDQDYFCEGLAEEILNALASISGMRVASRTSSFRFRDSATDARDIGRALNVAAIMEGSVRKAGDHVRVTAQLVDAGNGYHLWSENFDRKLQDANAADSMGDGAHATVLSRQALERALAEADLDPENGRARYLAAGLQVRLGDTEAGKRNAEAALRMRPDDYGTLYNAACVYAQVGEFDRALDLLDRAVATGQGFREWIDHDHDFDVVRQLPRFQEIVARLDEPVRG